MKKRNYKLVMFATLVLLVASCLVMLMFSSHKGEVLIENKARVRILLGEIEICNQRFKFQDIMPGEKRQILYKVKSDSHYKIMVTLESGKKLVKEIGYVTNGLDFKDVLIVNDDDISYAQDDEASRSLPSKTNKP